MTWRQRAQQVIQTIEAAHRDATLAEFKAALFVAYPFGQREYTPYKIWCQEVKLARARHEARANPQAHPETGDLFSEVTE